MCKPTDWRSRGVTILDGGKERMSGLFFVPRGFDKKQSGDGEQTLPSQHITEEACQGGGIVVPFDLPELRIVRQQWQADGSIRVETIAACTQVTCPHCQQACQKIHDTRARKKRDLSLGGHRVELILFKRRFRCGNCTKIFTEPDTVCGWKRRTTARLREMVGKQAWSQQIAHVAAQYGVGPRFVGECLQGMAASEDLPIYWQNPAGYAS
jgi:hypothetical protein